MTVTTVLNIISAFGSLAAAMGILLAFNQLRLNRKQLNVAMMVKCIDNYRQLNLFTAEGINPSALWKYVDLVSEELFYIQEGYLPDAVSREWLDGMIDLMPIIDKTSGDIVNPEQCIQELADRGSTYFQGYPCIKASFVCRNSYQWDVIYNPSDGVSLRRQVQERNRLIDELLRNVAQFNQY